MPEPAWLTYVGAVTGIVVAVTAIAGAIMGYVVYRCSEQFKALDLRLELRKAENVLRSMVNDLLATLERAKKSRTAVSAATGLYGSGAFQQWMSNWEADLAVVKSLEAGLPDANSDHRRLTHSELEAKLVAVHALKSQATQLQEKYQAALLADDKEREQLRADLRVRTQATLEGKQ